MLFYFTAATNVVAGDSRGTLNRSPRALSSPLTQEDVAHDNLSQYVMFTTGSHCCVMYQVRATSSKVFYRRNWIFNEHELSHNLYMKILWSIFLLMRRDAFPSSSVLLELVRCVGVGCSKQILSKREINFTGLGPGGCEVRRFMRCCRESQSSLWFFASLSQPAAKINKKKSFTEKLPFHSDTADEGGWLFVRKWPRTQKCGKFGERERIFITLFFSPLPTVGFFPFFGSSTHIQHTRIHWIMRWNFPPNWI